MCGIIIPHSNLPVSPALFPLGTGEMLAPGPPRLAGAFAVKRLASLALLLASPAALANAPPPAPPAWEVDLDGDMTLAFGDDIRISCPEAKKQLRVTIAPAWEVGYGKDDGTTFTGPTDKVSVTFGDKTFPAVQDAAVKDEAVYVLAADADSVTAVMMATNAKVTLTSDPQQIREGQSDDSGAFDMFATTCAQINGLK